MRSVFLRTDHRNDEFPLAALVPNVITTLALCCGLGALHFALTGKLERSLALVVLSGVLDVLDGGAARMLRVSSRFGAMLDSLSDFLAFGIVPAVLLHQLHLKPTGQHKALDAIGLAAVMTFALCAALRLARFTSALPATLPASARHARKANAEHAPPKQRASPFFQGLPTPGGAGAALVPALLTVSDAGIGWHLPSWGTAIYIILIAMLMVSRVPMFAVKGVRVSRRTVVPILLFIGVLAALMFIDPWLTLAGLSAFYLALTPLAIFLKSRKPALQPAPSSP
jgi:CDP-diacylglycerol--serine O-phosphatidyltransferase